MGVRVSSLVRSNHLPSSLASLAMAALSMRNLPSPSRRTSRHSAGVVCPGKTGGPQLAQERRRGRGWGAYVRGAQSGDEPFLLHRQRSCLITTHGGYRPCGLLGGTRAHVFK